MLLSLCATSTRGMRRRSDSGARTAACQRRAASDSGVSAIGTLSSYRVFLPMGGGAGYRRTPLRGVDRTRRKSVTSTIFDNQKQPPARRGVNKKRKNLLGLRGAAADRGGGVLLRQALDQAVDAFLLHHCVELRAVGENQAHAVDRDV